MQLKKGGLYCLDFQSIEDDLFGSNENAAHSVLDIMVVPCNLDNRTFGSATAGIPDDCVWSQEEVYEYIGEFSIVSYHNHGYFDNSKFGYDAV